MWRHHALLLLHAQEEVGRASCIEVGCVYGFNGLINSTDLLCRVSELVESVTKKPTPGHVTSFVMEVCVNDRDGEDVEVPYIRIKFR